MIIDFKKAFLKRKNSFLVDQIYSSIETHLSQLATHAIWLCQDQYSAELALHETANRISHQLSKMNTLEQLQNTIYIELKHQCSEFCSNNNLDERISNPSFVNSELIKALNEIPECYREPLAMQIISRIPNSDMMRYLDISEKDLMRRLHAARETLFSITQYSAIAKEASRNPSYA